MPYIWNGEGWLHVAVVLDLCSRRVVGWSMNEQITARLIADALVMPLWRRGRPCLITSSGSIIPTADIRRLALSVR